MTYCDECYRYVNQDDWECPLCGGDEIVDDGNAPDFYNEPGMVKL